MKIRLPDLSFSIPDGFIDDTNYTFSSSDEKEHLRGEEGTFNAITATPDQVLNDKLSQAKYVLGDEVSVSPLLHLAIEPYMASMGTLAYQQSRETYNEFHVVIPLDGQHYFHVAFRTTLPLLEAKNRFNMILEGTELPGKVTAGTFSFIPSEFYPVNVGRVVMHVPASLHPPSAYSFIGREGQFHIDAFVRRLPKSLGALAEDMELEMKKESQRGAATDRRNAIHLTAPAGEAFLQSYHVKKERLTKTESFAVAQLHMMLRIGINLSLVATRQLPASAFDLKAEFQNTEEMLKDIMNSVEYESLPA